jgi:hypothetical protein
MGPEILPGTREYQWVASVVEATERATGRPSPWNRRLYEELGEVGGTARIGGGPMTISRPRVLEPVMRAYDAPGSLDLPTTGEVRRGVIVVVHETDHHQHEAGDQIEPDAVRFASPEFVVMTEGLAEINRDRVVDRVIEDIGADNIVPRIHKVQTPTGYVGYQAGVEGVLQGLHTLSGRPPDEVWEDVDQAPLVHRYNAMADVLIDARLNGLMPEWDRGEIRRQLSQPLKDELGSLTQDALDIEPPDQLAQRGRETGARAVLRVEQVLKGVEARYKLSVDAETARLRQFLEVGGTTAGSGAGAGAGGGAAAGAGAASLHVPSFVRRRDEWSR